MGSSSDRKELNAKWKTEVEVPTITKDEVAKHNSKQDLWIIIHGKVYNVTEYARDHPGGADAIYEVAGTDSTSAYEDVGHSEDAREIMHPFLVGVVEGFDSLEVTTKPKVQIVRRGASKQINKTAPMTFPIQLAAFAIGTTTLTWAFSRSLTRGVGSIGRISLADTAPEHHGGFVQGFIWATALCAVAGVIGYRQITKAVSFDRSFSSYPAHIHASAVVPSTNRPAGVLLPQEYQKFPLIRKDQISKDAFRFVFALPSKISVLGLPIGQHVAIRGYTDDETGHHTITRSYTPMSNNSDLGRLELVIKIYPDGQLTGKYLANLKVGDEVRLTERLMGAHMLILGDKVEFRGPKGAMTYRKGMSKRLGMIAGGTGITPMYQLIRAICEDKTDATQIDLIYANKTEDDILLREQLDGFARKAPSKFRLFYILDSPTSAWQGGVGWVSKQMIQEKLPPADSQTKILLCGPPGMVNASKKALVELGFDEPGAVSKMSDQIFLF